MLISDGKTSDPSFAAAGDFSRHENHIDTRNSAVKE